MAAGFVNLLAGRILPLICELNFFIRMSSALFLHFVSCRCMYYVSCMYVAPMFPYVNFCIFHSTEACARHV